MLTSRDPTSLRTRAWDHGGRPLTSPRLVRISLGGVPAIATGGLVFVAESDADAARPAAEEAGMTDAGVAPLMVLELDTSLAEAPSVGVERAVDADCVQEVAELIRAAFGVDANLRADLPDVPGADAWLLREDGRAIAALVATSDPDFVAIWSMATLPSRRHEGHARHLLRAVLGHYALEGAARACLVATPEGERLYRSVGFEPVEQLRVWRPAAR
jgi:ribosomal protein S18 acetylase RimI-like enzyme